MRGAGNLNGLNTTKIAINNTRKINWMQIFKSNGIVIAFIFIMLFFSLASDVFLTVDNISLVLRQVAVIGIVSLAIFFIMLTGNFDLSIGGSLSLAAIIVVDLHDKIGPLSAIIIALLAGILIGCINGYLVGMLNLNSIIATLGMFMILQGLTYIASGAKNKSIADPGSTWFPIIGRGSAFGVSIPIIIFFVLILIFGIVHTKTIYGRYLIASGSNKTASLYSGVQQNWVVLSTYVIAGLAAAIGAIVLSSRNLTVTTASGAGFEFDALAAVILGGTSLLGGVGSVYKVVFGVLILGFIKNGFILLGFPHYTQQIVTWVIILLAVSIDLFSNRGRSRA